MPAAVKRFVPQAAFGVIVQALYDEAKALMNAHVKAKVPKQELMVPAADEQSKRIRLPQLRKPIK